MKKIVSLAVLTFLLASAFAQDAATAWRTVYPLIQKNIKAPVFKNKDYNIKDFGAIPNDAKVLNHEAINRAIATCSMNGGGHVVVPAGVWHTAPITLKSDVNLHVSEGATLLFTTNPDYFPIVLTRWEGLDVYTLQPLVYAYGEKNIAITGKGTIDGGAENENWWKQCGAPRFGWKEGDISQKIGRPKLQQWSNDKTPVTERILSKEDGLRPQLINFYLCKNVLIEGVKLLRSPFWVIHPLLCDNVTVRGVHIENDGPNGDGCDPESCTNVLIENCYFNTGDDCIAIKAGRNNDGRRWMKPSENIIVRNCEMKNGHGGVVIGSEITGGYKNLFVENCNMDSPELERVIRLKSNTIRGGVMENIYVRNIKVGECKRGILDIDLLYEPKELGERVHVPLVRNIYMENVTSEKSRYGLFIAGLPEQTSVSSITLSNCNYKNVAEGNSITGKTKDIHYKNLVINGKRLDQ